MMARKSNGDILLFLNPNVECIQADWMTKLVEYCCRDNTTGAVSGRLLREDETIFHAGIIIGTDGTYGYSHHGDAKDSLGYAGQLLIARNVSAVSADCLMIRKELFEKMNGFDVNFDRECYDVDFCLSLIKSGYQNIWTPLSSLKICSSNPESNQKDRKYFQNKWQKEVTNSDPYYNINLSTQQDYLFTPAGCEGT